MMKRISLFFLLTFLTAQAMAQTPAFPTSGDIYLGLKKLNVLGSVLYIAAHPDDENTRLLTYFSKDKLYRTGYLSLTRGDGGQNLIGDEQGVELGLIRTQELLSARRIDGAEQFFSRAFDFGYSKSPEETFTKWDREKILSDVVWVIRKFQPDVIITRFPTTGEGGHGQHTASAILAVEAFTAAADAKRFPDQLKYVQVWQAKRLLWNTFNFGNTNTTSNDQFKIDAGGFNPVLGKSYGEIAAESRSQHKSQGFGVARSRGEAIEYFRTLGGSAPVVDLMDGVNKTWSQFGDQAAVQQVEKLVNEAIAQYDFAAPQKSLSALLSIAKEMDKLPSYSAWSHQKRQEIMQLIFVASGLWAEAYTTIPTVAQGDSVQINIGANNRMGQTVILQGVTIEFGHDWMLHKQIDTTLSYNKNFIYNWKLKLPASIPISQPYWLNEKMSEGFYNVSDQQLIGRPDAEPAATVNLQLIINGNHLQLEGLPVKFKFSDQVKGELYEPFVVLPPYTINIPQSIHLIAADQEVQKEFTYTAQKNLDSLVIYNFFNGVVNRRKVNKGYQGKFTTTVKDLFAGSSPLTRIMMDAYFEQPILITNPFTDSATPKRTTAKQLHTIKYDHIPYLNYFTDAVDTYISLNVKTEGHKIGYIVGAGDKVPQALGQMGYEVTLLTEKELERTNLQQFDAILSGVRAFNTNDWMGKYYDKLMKYVQDGGNYIVQYSQNNNIRAPKIGPYNFTVSGKRITDEGAAVTFLKPQHPVLNYPNVITQEDFKGWIQERSIYHADGWDAGYEPILRMNDPGEAPHDGSLIIGKYGKGFFTYTGLVFFRELPAGVPGAYRLLANIIALNKIKGS